MTRSALVSLAAQVRQAIKRGDDADVGRFGLEVAENLRALTPSRIKPYLSDAPDRP